VRDIRAEGLQLLPFCDNANFTSVDHYPEMALDLVDGLSVHRRTLA
jgi:hypothetical protein